MKPPHSSNPEVLAAYEAVGGSVEAGLHEQSIELSTTNPRLYIEDRASSYKHLPEGGGLQEDESFVTSSEEVKGCGDPSSCANSFNEVDHRPFRRLMACAEGISLPSLELLIDFADRLRSAEDLPEKDDGD